MPDYQHDPVAFCDAFIPRNEKGQSFSLSAHQRQVLGLAFCASLSENRRFWRFS